jgi:hypothetical protein
MSRREDFPMNDASRSRTALSHLWVATSVPAVVFLASLPAPCGPAVPHESTHPETCRARAASTPEVRAARDACRLGAGAIGVVTASDGFSE